MTREGPGRPLRARRGGEDGWGPYEARSGMRCGVASARVGQGAPHTGSVNYREEERLAPLRRDGEARGNGGELLGTIGAPGRRHRASQWSVSTVQPSCSARPPGVRIFCMRYCSAHAPAPGFLGAACRRGFQPGWCRHRGPPAPPVPVTGLRSPRAKFDRGRSTSSVLSSSPAGHACSKAAGPRAPGPAPRQQRHGASSKSCGGRAAELLGVKARPGSGHGGVRHPTATARLRASN